MMITLKTILENPLSQLNKKLEIQAIFVVTRDKNNPQNTLWYVMPLGLSYPDWNQAIPCSIFHPESALKSAVFFLHRHTKEYAGLECLVFDPAKLEVFVRLSGANSDLIELEVLSLEVDRGDYVCYVANGGVPIEKYLESKSLNDYSVGHIIENKEDFLEKYLCLKGEFRGNDSANLFYITDALSYLKAIQVEATIKNQKLHQASISLDFENLVDILEATIGGAIGTDFVWNESVIIGGLLQASTEGAFPLTLTNIDQMHILRGNKYVISLNLENNGKNN